MLGGLAGLAGWMWSTNLQLLSGVLLAGAVGLVVVAYVAISRRQVDGTTESAALVVLAAGTIAGIGQLKLASGVIAVTALLLVEKSGLHALIRRLDDAGLRAGFRFAVMAIVILPLLPPGPYGPFGGIRPRQLWILVLFFSGLSFAGYVARLAVGNSQGYLLAGLLGGLISSTNVTLSFAKVSRRESESAEPLALGVVAACAVMCVRMLAASAVLNERVASALVPYLAVPFVVTVLTVAIGARRDRSKPGSAAPPSNPLQFISALEMAGLFQLVLFVVNLARTTFGQSGVLFSAGVLGLTDVDALVIAMTRGAIANESVSLAALAIAIGAFTNTLLKLTLGLAIGRGRFRVVVGAGLTTMALAFAGSILWLH
jgi:uncharacterized membrane protein (DUF4010 family)